MSSNYCEKCSCESCAFEKKVIAFKQWIIAEGEKLGIYLTFFGGDACHVDFSNESSEFPEYFAEELASQSITPLNQE